MIYLEFLDGQGLGNQLWNYVTLRSICKKKSLAYTIINPEKFKGKHFLNISFRNNLYKNKRIKPHPEIKIKHFFNEKLYYDNELESYACDFDKRILEIKPNTNIKGLFQSERYLFNFNINEFIKTIKRVKRESKISKNQCVLNIRGGEYKRHMNLILPRSYWLNAIENMKIFRKDLEFCIITDDYNYASKLFPNLNIIEGDISDDFYNLLNADYVIVSNSSFAYFPINLGKKPKKVIAPANWSRFGNSYNRWISPSNYYKLWSYQNNKGQIISKEEIEKSIKATKKVYFSYNILTNENSLQKKKILDFIPIRFKFFIKKILSKVFPLLFGL